MLEQLGDEYKKATANLEIPFDRRALIMLRAIVPHSLEDGKPVADCATGIICLLLTQT
jgi:hypothetical protein